MVETRSWSGSEDPRRILLENNNTWKKENKLCQENCEDSRCNEHWGILPKLFHYPQIRVAVHVSEVNSHLTKSLTDQSLCAWSYKMYLIWRCLQQKICKLSTTSLQIAYQSLTRFIYVHLNDKILGLCCSPASFFQKFLWYFSYITTTQQCTP